MPRRLRGIVAAAALLAAGAILLWVSLNAAAGWVLERLVARAGIPSAHFVVKRVGLSRIDIAQARLAVETDADLTDIAFEDTTVRFAFAEPHIRAVEARHARARWQSRGTSASSAPVGPLVVPLEALAIHDLEIVLDAPPVRFAWRGSLEAQRGPDGGARARLTDAHHDLELKLPSSGTAADIRLWRDRTTEVLTATLSDLDRERIRVRARFDLVGTWDWLSESMPAVEDRRSAPLLQRAQDLALPLRGASVEVRAVATPAVELLEADAVVSLANRRLLSVAARPAKKGALDIEVRGETGISDALALVKPLLPAALAGASLGSGTLSFSGRMRHAAGQWTGSGELNLTGASGTFNSLEIRELELAAQLDALLPIRGSLTAKAGSVRLAADIELTNLGLRVERRDDLLHVTEAVADGLGGRMTLAPAVIDPSRPPHVTTLSARGLDLGRILALFGRPELSGSGSLDARLPLRFASEQFEVQNGTLTGTSPGTLRYRTEQPDNIALQVLSDLQYRSLDAALDYDRDGEYRVRARMVGHNPELLAGHPVALNLNVSGRLPRLLAAALLSGDFSGHVLKELSGNHAGTAIRP